MKKYILAAAILGTASAAQAGPISITSDYGSTAAFQALGASNIPVESVYTHGLAAGAVTDADDLIFDGDINKILNFNDVGQGSFGELVPIFGTDSTGYNNDWRITFEYEFSGTALLVDGLPPFAPDGTVDGDNNGQLDFGDGIVPTYTAGIIKMFYHDISNPGSANDGEQVLELTLNYAQLIPFTPNVIFFMEVDYGWYGGGNAFIDNFFNDVETGKSFYELSQLAPPPVISFRLDFNLDDPTQPNAIPACVDADCLTLTRENDFNATGIFAVPEPASLAVLGLGLLGLGFSSRKRAAKAA